MTITVTPATFRETFPEFANVTMYPNAIITYWVSIAALLLNETLWSTLIDHGVSLFVAHNIALEARSLAEAAQGAPVGGGTGPINSKSVDKVSVGYDTAAAMEKDAGHWNLTIYGTRFIRLAKLIGHVPLQVGVGCIPPYSGPAWFGPYPWPSITGFSS